MSATTARPATRRKASAAADDATDTPPAAETAEPDLSAILPDLTSLTVAGIRVEIRRLRMRELMHIVRAITKGIGADLTNFRLVPGDKDFGTNLVALLMLALPEAVDEVVDLFVSIVTPVNPKEADRLVEEMQNPDPDDALSIMAAVVLQEKDDLVALWGKLSTLIGATAALYRTGKKGS